MSSLAAARADNFYYPPDYRPEHGSLNKYRGSHPLGSRAKNIAQGILTIRFEMPFKVFCTQCNQVIAKGVRFNAEKQCIGMYFSTKILMFSMKCCFCSNQLRIQTDPKKAEYIVVEGLVKKNETFSSEDVQTLEFRSAEERHAIESDPVLKLETVLEGKKKQESNEDELEALLKVQQDKFGYGRDYSSNALLRRSFRSKTKEIVEHQKKQTTNFVLSLPSPLPEEEDEASRILFRTAKSESHLAKRIKTVNAKISSLFPCKPPNKPQKKVNVHDQNVFTHANKSTQKKVIPTSHPALSLVVHVAEKPTPVKAETPDERKLRLHTQREKLLFYRRLAS